MPGEKKVIVFKFQPSLPEYLHGRGYNVSNYKNRIRAGLRRAHLTASHRRDAFADCPCTSASTAIDSPHFIHSISPSAALCRPPRF